MKVTAIINDALIKEAKAYSNAKTITEAITVALSEWVELKKIAALNKQVAAKPLAFKDGFSAHSVRTKNRKR